VIVSLKKSLIGGIYKEDALHFPTGRTKLLNIIQLSLVPHDVLKQQKLNRKSNVCEEGLNILRMLADDVDSHHPYS
jgi:hypothetical protein